MTIKFSETGRKLADGIIPAGTTVWKKCREGEIVQMIALEDGIIPEENRKQIQSKISMIVKKSGAYGYYRHFRKCRVPKVYVVSITNADGTTANSARSNENYNFQYKVGEIVESNEFDRSPAVVCTYGIHCFLTRAEAEKYNWS